MGSILVVEDEVLLGKTFQVSLSEAGHQVHWVVSAEEALEWLSDRHVDLALVDVRLPGLDGLDLLKEMSQSHPETVVIMMTAQSDVQTAVQAMKLGSADFLTKPVDLEAVTLIAERHLKNRRLVRGWKHEQKSRTQVFGLHQIIGDCPEIEKAKAMVRRLCRLGVSAAERPPNVLITGETGTGKDLLARAFHYEGSRRDGPFVQVNCAALPESLVESELFGHTKGAFTDARSGKQGLFEVADQGTLFLDEIGALALSVQAKILTAIESGRIRPVGSVEERSVSVHLVAAMNQDPHLWVRDGKLREDLYHRLRVVHVTLPPLRERGSDVARLADHFIAQHCRKFGMERKTLTAAARKAIRDYRWPGNVRELCHRLESAVLLSGAVIEADLLPTAQRPVEPAKPPSGTINIDFSRGPVSLEGVERDLIEFALTESKYNVTRAAELLCVTRDFIRHRIEKHGLLSKSEGGDR